MTDRDIMQQALEALELLSRMPTETALDYASNAIDALKEKLAQPEQEPVAIYQYQMSNGSWMDHHKESHDYNTRHGQTTTFRIVYTNPPQRKPLTDEEIRQFWREATMKPKYTSEFVEDFARAIEAAHGIKGEA